MIAPEGRNTNGRKLIQFKLGAFHAGEPVQPVVLRYHFKHFNPACVGRNRNIASWAFRMMTQFANWGEVEILEAEEPDGDDQDDCMNFAIRVRALMADCLGIETTEHTVEDAFLFRESVRANVDTDFELQNVVSLFNVDLDQLTEWLAAFQKIDKDSSGRIDRFEFTRVMKRYLKFGDRQSTISINRLFDFFDTDDSGGLEYREFVQCLATLSGKCSAKTQAKLAFLIYDVEGKGRIKRSLLRDALDNAFAAPHAGPSVLPRAMSHQIPLPRDASRKIWKQCLSDEANRTLPEKSVSCQERMRVGTALLSNGGGDSAPSWDDELDFESFYRLAGAKPEVLDLALMDVRSRFSRSVRNVSFNSDGSESASGSSSDDSS